MRATGGDDWQRRCRWVLILVEDWTVADLGPDLCALCYWDGPDIRVIVSDLVRGEHVSTVAIHARTHRADPASSPSWGETTACCERAHCWAAQTWLPACLAESSALAPPA